MNIGIDIRPLQLSPEISGIGVYLRNLVCEISRIDHQNQYFFLKLKEGKEVEIDLDDGFKWTEIHVPSARLKYLNVLQDPWVLPGIVERHSLDLLHFPSPFELKSHFDLKRHNRKSVLTVYDLTPLFYGDKIFVRKRKMLRPLYLSLLKAVPRAGHIISISENTKKDFVKNLNMSPEKITVIHLGKDESFRKITFGKALKKVREKYNLPNDFILYVGGFSYHKNIFSLLEALALIRLEYRLEIPLVIAGRIDPFFFSELEQKIDQLILKKQVIFTGFVPFSDLPALYNLALAFVSPSLYEGFGLPVLEALACGTPVVCSNTSSLPEVAGDAAVYFDPENITDIAEAIHRTVASEEIQVELQKKGIKRAEKFTWEKTARETLKVYRTLKVQ